MERDHRDHKDDRHNQPPVVPPAPPPAAAGEWPTEAPPSPREEKQAAKAGYVWVNGHWDWKARKWDWTPGHWEREQANKHWREGRWEQRSGHYEWSEGGWDAAGGPPPPGDHHDRDHDRDDHAGTPPGPGPQVREHRREWRIERPVVSSYWPTKGKTGTKIVIHGDNFASDSMVMWGGTEIKGAKVRDNEIVFEVPSGAASGPIMIHGGKDRRPLFVGNFEVAASFDPIAEQKRLDDERRKAAEAAWASQVAKANHDRAARQAEVDRREGEWESTREQRRMAREKEIKAKWDNAFLADGDTQAELTLHAQRVAEITRMRDVVEVTGDQKMGVRIEAASSREDYRHDARMQALHDSFGHNGGMK